jgi:hypothetical protein
MNGADTADHGDSHATATPRSHGATTATSPSLPMERCCLARPPTLCTHAAHEIPFLFPLIYSMKPIQACAAAA